jgi:hypothetical protein
MDYHHRIHTRLRRPAFLVAVLGAVLVTSPVAAAGFGPTKVLRSAPTGIGVNISSVEAWRDNIVVGWREDPGPGYKNYLRWSTDGGNSFGPLKDLGFGDFNYGGVADICGGFVIALTGPTSNHQLIKFSLDGDTETSRDLFGPSEGIARSASLTCAGNRRFVVASNDDSISPPHTKVIIQPLFESIPSYFFDLRPSDSNFSPAVAATDEAIHVAWISGGQLRYKRFSIANNQNATVTAHATQNLVGLPGGGEVALGAFENQVALAFRSGHDTKLRLSSNGGQSFGAAQTVIDQPDGGTITSWPGWADIRNNRILLAIGQSDTSLGFPDQISSYGLLSKDSGASRAATPTHVGGFLANTLFKTGGALRVAEAWDPSYYSSLAHEKIRFHKGNP